MHDFPPNVDWHWTTLLATVLGYLVCGNFTVKEQIAIGNWILQIGQTVMTNSTYQDLLEYRIMGKEQINLNSATFKSGGSPFINQGPPPNFEQFYEAFRNHISDTDLSNLHEAIKRINEELNKIRANLEN